MPEDLDSFDIAVKQLEKAAKAMKLEPEALEIFQGREHRTMQDNSQ